MYSSVGGRIFLSALTVLHTEIQVPGPQGGGCALLLPTITEISSSHMTGCHPSVNTQMDKMDLS